MSGTDEFVNRYVAVWHEPDAEARRRAVAEIWADDGRYVNQSNEFHGHSGIEVAVTEAYEQFVKKGFVFRASPEKPAAANHAAIRLTWIMAPAEGGDVAAQGTQFIIRDADGRARYDYQFPEGG